MVSEDINWKKDRYNLINNIVSLLHKNDDYTDLDEYYYIYSSLLDCVKSDLINYGVSINLNDKTPTEYVYKWLKDTEVILKLGGAL